MKHTCILLIIVISYFPLAAQTVFPAAADQPVWHLSTHTMNGNGQATTFVSYNTVACGQTWNVAQQYFTHPNGQNSNTWTIGYYREEGPRVYFRQTLNCEDREYLMYDFSLETGDSVWVGVPGTLFAEDTVLVSVLQTSNICLNGRIRKTIHLKGLIETSVIPQEVNMQWIEGLGAVGGFFLVHPFYSGICFTDNCETQYQIQCVETSAGFVYGDMDGPCNPSVVRRIHVNAAAEGGIHNGISWYSAFRDLQDALAIATSGDTVQVAQGTYFPTEDGDREKRFLLKNGVVLLGGFNATECATADRDPVLYETILSGDIGMSGDSTDNSFHVVFTLGTDTTTVLDGFTITRGQAIHPDGGTYSGHLDRGGGLYVGTIPSLPHANPRIRNCRFILNVGKNGGAMYCDGTADGRSADPILENCTFEYNRASSAGGAIYKKGISHPNQAFAVRNCNFGYNRSAQLGGAIYFFDGGNTNAFFNTLFYNNLSISGGGGIYYETHLGESLFFIDNCKFIENISDSGGALLMASPVSHPDNINGHRVEINYTVFEKNQGLFNTAGAIGILDMPRNKFQVSLKHCLFYKNHALYEGAGIDFFTAYGSTGILEIEYCHFLENQSPREVASCIFMHGFNNNDLLPIKNTLNIHNTLFSNNDGVIALLSGVNGAADGLVQNCTFYQNGQFPIIKNWSSNFNYITFYNRMEIANSIIWEPEAIPGQLFYNNSLANPSLHDYNLHHNLISTPDCNLPGGEVACGEDNIFAAWPAFLDTLNGDFRIAACSPAVNSGINEGIANLLTDLDGNPRILDSLVDIGAYERRAYRIDSVVVMGASCAGGSNGSAFLSLTGNGPYQYNWQTDAGQTGEGHENLPAGDYHFSVTDALGCSDTVSVKLPEPEAIVASFVITNASAANAADASIVLDDLTGGTPPYRFFWNTSDTSASLGGLLPGLYALTILDAQDCTHLLHFEVSFANATTTPEENWRLQVSPNPVQSGQRLRIWQIGEAVSEVVISIWDAQGRIMQQLLMNGTEAYLDTNTLAEGVYWLHWQRANGRKGNVRIVML